MGVACRAPEDPYVKNSIGNCQASLGDWDAARGSYLAAVAIFQKSVGFRDSSGASSPRLDGASFSQSNAALALAQLGDLSGAQKEFEYIARRQAGSVDARAALAALYYHEGRYNII
jgi:hypothetical protein